MTTPPDFLTGEAPMDETDHAVREAWRIDGDREATWALRKLATVEAERQRIRLLHQAEVARLDAWATDADRPLAHDAEFFTGKLIDYRRRLEADNPELPKTYKLPNGSLARRAGRLSTVVEDEAAFIAWAIDAHPEALTVKPKVSALSTLPRLEGGEVVDTDTGQTVPGVRSVRGEDRYEIRPADLSTVDAF